MTPADGRDWIIRPDRRAGPGLTAFAAAGLLALASITVDVRTDAIAEGFAVAALRREADRVACRTTALSLRLEDRLVELCAPEEGASRP